MRKKNLAIVFMLCAFALALPLAAHACPGCSSTFSKSLAGAFNASVLFMMAMPFALFSAFILGFMKLNRQAHKNATHVKQTSPNPS